MIEVIVMVILCICLIAKLNFVERRVEFLEAELTQIRIERMKRNE